jgi:hypothetical protein
MTRPIAVILITHTPERLRRTVLGVAWSSLPAREVVLACDGDDPAILDAARDAAREAGSAITVVQRPSAGRGRAAQTRNNAVRALLDRGAPPETGLVFFDGDCVPLHRTVEGHAAGLGRADLVLGFRYDLTAEQDAAFDERALRDGEMPLAPTPAQVRALHARHRRYRRQLLLRRLGLTKPHKPKLLSANFACTLEAYRAVNGFDEDFEGWGQEDDDFGRRLMQWGGRVHVGIRSLLACHQFHQTRAPGDWHESDNARMLRARRPVVCARGLSHPADQLPPVVSRIVP